MVRVPTHRPPTHPGEMLLEEFLEPLEMTQTELANRIEVPFQRVNSLVNGRRALTPDTALRLSRLFGTSASFWMNHQLRWDLYHAQRSNRQGLQRIKPVGRAKAS
ncbi:MAG: HigA family addiction module antitoxin [Gemmatimonadota bacterium]